MRTKLLFLVTLLLFFISLSAKEGGGQPDSEKVEALIQRAAACMKSDTVQSNLFLDEAHALSRKIGYNQGVVEVALKRGVLKFYAGLHDEAVAMATFAENLAKEAGLTDLRYDAVKLLAETNLESGDLKASERYWDEIMAYGQRVGDSARICNVWIGKSYVYEGRGEMDSCMQASATARDIAEQLGDPHLMAEAYSALGRVYLYSGDPETGEDYHARAVAAHIEAGSDIYNINAARNNLAVARSMKGDYAGAKASFREIYQSYVDENLLPRAASSLGNLALAYRFSGELDSAIALNHKAIDMQKALGIRMNVSRNLMTLGDMYLEAGKPQKALAYFKEGLEYDFPNSLFRTQLQAQISLAYEELGDLRQALDHYKIYARGLDTLHAQEVETKTKEIEERYGAEKKEQEIRSLQRETALQDANIAQNKRWIWVISSVLLVVLLLSGLLFRFYQEKNKANTALNASLEKIRHQAAQIEVALGEKETLLKEIHHRVKNNLQVVSSMLTLQSNLINDPAALRMLQEGRDRVHSMSLVHQKLYMVEDHARISLQDYCAELLGYLRHSYDTKNRVRAELDFGEIRFNLETALPLGLIINELVTNSYKYAFQEGQEAPQIVLRVRQEKGERYAFHYSDNGVGMAQDFDFARANSMGLKLVRLLSRQLKGQPYFSGNNGFAFDLLLREI